MASRRVVGSVNPGKPGPLVFAGKPAEIAAKRCAEVARLTHRLRPGMQARERTRGGATRDTLIVNREGQRVVQLSASLTSERGCAECWGSGLKPASRFSVK